MFGEEKDVDTRVLMTICNYTKVSVSFYTEEKNQDFYKRKTRSIVIPLLIMNNLELMGIREQIKHLSCKFDQFKVQFERD